MRTCVFLLVAFALAGCPKKKEPAGPPGGGGGSFDERQSCTVDTDCAVVEIECCDHCNGGTVVAVHRDYLAEVESQYASPEECADVACTKMACVDQPVAICKQSICGVRIGKSEDTPALPAP